MKVLNTAVKLISVYVNMYRRQGHVGATGGLAPQ